MARQTKNVTQKNIGLRISNYLKSGKVESVDLYENDLVTNLNYLYDDTDGIEKVSGRIASINYNFNKATVKKTKRPENYLESDCSIVNITVDASTKNKSNLVVINAEDILEYQNTEEVDHVEVTPIMKVALTVYLSDTTSSAITFEIGKDLYDVTIKEDNGKETTADYVVKSFVYNFLPNTSDAEIVGVGLDGENYTYVEFNNFISCGKEGIVVDESTTLTEAVTYAKDHPEVGGIRVNAGSQAELLTIDGNIKIKGPSISSLKSDVIGTDEYSLESGITLSKNGEVIISGMTITKNSKVNLAGAKKAVFNKCKFVDCIGTKGHDVFITDTFDSNEDGIVMIFDGCYFGNNVKDENEFNIYNLLELNCKLADGSAIRNCYFAKAGCTHNYINIYDVKDDATITIENNYFEYSANAIRVGIKGSPKAVINIKNNTYVETDTTYPDYAGLLLVQPYGKATETMKDLVINIDNTTTPGGQLWYYYAGENDAQLEGDDKGFVYVNGVREIK